MKTLLIIILVLTIAQLGFGQKKFNWSDNKIKKDSYRKLSISAPIDGVTSKNTYKYNSSSCDTLISFLKKYPSKSFRIEVHEGVLRTEEISLKITKRFANAIMGVLVDKGVDVKNIEVIGVGESNPIIKEEDIDAENNIDKIRIDSINNRRVLLIVNEDIK